MIRGRRSDVSRPCGGPSRSRSRTERGPGPQSVPSDVPDTGQDGPASPVTRSRRHRFGRIDMVNRSWTSGEPGAAPTRRCAASTQRRLGPRCRVVLVHLCVGAVLTRTGASGGRAGTCRRPRTRRGRGANLVVHWRVGGRAYLVGRNLRRSRPGAGGVGREGWERGSATPDTARSTASLSYGRE